ncbi:MAG: UDP-N-acetylglucosamine--LPS N-acetylglucosamine transferase [Cyanobacteriota bacterium]|nr:UDP-N-acetylglucosamine--LPS N-acetylglucosamine transferase [Cyanobacteriota bacterium]
MIYALGGGWGHLTRALSLAKIVGAKALNTKGVQVLTNSPYLAYFPPSLLPKNCTIQGISPFANAEETRDRVREILLATAHNCLIVDTFPRGLGGELAALFPSLPRQKRVLIHRDLNPNYVEAKNLSQFVAQWFDLILIPGEGCDLPLAHLPQVQHTPPWLIRNAEELPDWETVCSILCWDREIESRRVLVLASGRAEERFIYGKLVQVLARSYPTIEVRCLAAEKPPECPQELWISYFPALDCLQGADVVAGGGGYNTVWECQAAGVPLVAFPFERLYDRQAARLRKARAISVGSVGEAVAAISCLLNAPRLHRFSPGFVNGATEAVEKIERVIN